MSFTEHRLKRRIGELLIDAELVTEAQLAEALDASMRADGVRERVGQTLVRLGFVTEQEIAESLAEQLGLDCVEAPDLTPDEGFAARIPAALARRFNMLPLREENDGTLLLACSDPTDVIGRDDVRMASGARSVRPLVAPVTELAFAIERAYSRDTRSAAVLGEITETAGPDADDEPISADDAPMIRLVDEIVVEAISLGASDIHIEPSQRGAVVRYRVDGVLRESMVVPRGAMLQLIARVKLMGSMDIAERRLPQDGRARFRHGADEVDLRISSLPSLHGETVVVRLLRKGAERLTPAQVGFTEDQLHRFLGTIERPQGLVLITGPTGSGKTSTLYAGLGHLADERRNIVTLEDPVEYELAGINQTHVVERIGRTFARCLRTVLRQDPDVVMVGEIRDAETAELALQAAMTGHLVLSTLHTNDAPSAVIRLRDLGVASYLIASSLTMVIGQRLVRKLCEDCSVVAPPTARQIAQLRLGPHDLSSEFRIGTGCNACGGNGYRGRVGIFEVLPIDAAIRDLLVAGASTPAIARAAQTAGMIGLREDGLAKAAAGLTSLEELLRVAPGDVEATDSSCPVCAQVVDPEFAHCPWCAFSLALPSCHGCDRTLESGWRVCPTCATPVPQAGASERLPRALIVDDDPSVRGAIAAMLTGDYETEQAGDAESALAIAHGSPFDVILVDVGLPDLDGYELTRRLRARPATREVPVIVVTGHQGRDVELAGLQAGADDLLTKPMDPEVLLARVDAVLRRGARGGGGAPQLHHAGVGHEAPAWEIPPPVS